MAVQSLGAPSHVTLEYRPSDLLILIRRAASASSPGSTRLTNVAIRSKKPSYRVSARRFLAKHKLTPLLTLRYPVHVTNRGDLTIDLSAKPHRASRRPAPDSEQNPLPAPLADALAALPPLAPLHQRLLRCGLAESQALTIISTLLAREFFEYATTNVMDPDRFERNLLTLVPNMSLEPRSLSRHEKATAQPSSFSR
jgi:hypothetical protein